MFSALKGWSVAIAVALVAAALASGIAGVRHWKAAAVRTAVADTVGAIYAAANQRADASILAYIKARTDSATARTDTVVQTIIRRVTETREVAAQIPDEVIQRYPVVGELRARVTTLAAATDSLVGVINTERALHRMRAATDSAEIVRVNIVARRLADDTLRLRGERDRRVTKGRAVLGAIGGAVIGGVTCAVLPRCPLRRD